jgi:hypothetical protein
MVDFGPSASAYHATDSYLTRDERKAYAWLTKQGDTAGVTSDPSLRGRLLDPGESPREQYLRAYSLAETPIWRFAGYYDNGAPIHTWEQNAWTDLRSLLRLHNVRYALLRENEALAERLRPDLIGLGYRVAMSSGAVTVYENPQIGEYAQLYHRAALDVTGDFYRSFEALPGLLWREIAMVAGDGLLNRQVSGITDSTLGGVGTRELGMYDYVLVGDGSAYSTSESILTSYGVEKTSPLSDKLITTADIERLDVSPRSHGVVWTRRPSYSEVYVEVQTPKAGILTIAESWYPHWRVSVDDRPAEVLRVNWALLGVHLDPGLHQVTFRYRRPLYVLVSYAASLLTALILVARWVRCLAARLDRGLGPLQSTGACGDGSVGRAGQ